MDLLSELLGEVRIATSAIGRFTLGAPFHLHAPIASPVSFVVLSGRCGWQRAGGPVHWLSPGDAVLGLRGTRHQLASDFSLPRVEMEAAWRANGLPLTDAPQEVGAPIRFAWGGDGERTELLAIAYAFERPLGHPMLQSLPDGLVIPAVDERQSAAVQGAVTFMNTESEVAQPGFAAMAARMAETLFLGLLRAYALQRGEVGPGSLRALHDQRLHGALRALHADPSRGWTVAELAGVAAMSRSVFAQRFTACLGMPPMAYVVALRMHIARRRLEAHAVPVGMLAEQMGYHSERAFRKAFQRSVGTSPSQWRRRQQQVPLDKALKEGDLLAPHLGGDVPGSG